MPQSAIDRFPANRRNEQMQKISRNARRLRQGIGQNGVVSTALVGRNDSLEQLLVRLGVIPILVLPTTSSLIGSMQAFPGRRPSTSEAISVSGGTAPQGFNVGDPVRNVPFTAGGTGQAATATDTVDASAKGRALIDILP
jgi:hypothetical protein